MISEVLPEAKSELGNAYVPSFLVINLMLVSEKGYIGEHGVS